MQIRWSAPAADDLECIFQHIEKYNPAAARDTIKAIYNGCATLEDFPYRGRPGRTEGWRELVFPPLPYIAVYRIKNDVVEISRIYHGAQEWP